MHLVRYMKISASELKLLQRRSKDEIPSLARQKELKQAFLID